MALKDTHTVAKAIRARILTLLETRLLVLVAGIQTKVPGVVQQVEGVIKVKEDLGREVA